MGTFRKVVLTCIGMTIIAGAIWGQDANKEAAAGESSKRAGKQKVAKPKLRRDVFRLPADQAYNAAQCLRALRIKGVSRIRVDVDDIESAADKGELDLEIVATQDGFDQAGSVIQLSLKSVGNGFSRDFLKSQGMPVDENEEKARWVEYRVPKEKAKVLAKFIRPDNLMGIKARANGNRLIFVANAYGQRVIAASMKTLGYAQAGEEKLPAPAEVPKK